MTNRRSYSGLMNLPVYGLYTDDAELVATIRTRDANDADVIFCKHGYVGGQIRRVDDPWTKIWKKLNAKIIK